MVMKNSDDWCDALMNNQITCLEYVAGLMYFRKFYDYWNKNSLPNNNSLPNSKKTSLDNADIVSIYGSIQGSITHRLYETVVNSINNSDFKKAFDFAYSVNGYSTKDIVYMGIDFINFLESMPNYKTISELTENLTKDIKSGKITAEKYSSVMTIVTVKSTIKMKVI